MIRRILALLTFALAAPAIANPPVASYIFPPGGQRGKIVPIKVGGLFLHESCSFKLVGPGVEASSTLKRTDTLWFNGPLLPLPESQQAEDYPQDMAGEITIGPDAPLGFRYGRVWTSQGAAPHLKFVVGDLPEIVEDELDGDPIPVLVSSPITINGRIFPREDVDVWSIKAKKGETYTCTVNAARIGSPLDARLEILDAKNRVLAENDDARGIDPAIRFTAPADGLYQIRIRDANMQGGQAYVFRLSIVAGPFVDRVFPLGGRQGTALTLDLAGHGLATPHFDIAIPEGAAKTGFWQLRLPGANVEPIWLDVDDAAEVVEGRNVPAEPLQSPVIVNGRIARAGEVDEWLLIARKGESLLLELRAAQLGSPLDAIVAVVDAAGKELLRFEGDKAVEWTAQTDGVVKLRVRDRFGSRGGPEFGYRLKMTQPLPDFRLVLLSDTALVIRKGQTKIKVNVLRQGIFNDPVAITVENLPAGVTALPLVVAANQNAADLTLKADETASIVAQEIRILGTPAPKLDKDAKTPAASKDPSATPPLSGRQATVAVSRGATALDTVLLAVALPTPFVIKGEFETGFAARGALHRRGYKIERNGFEGPIEIRLADRQARHLQGVTGPTVIVPADKSEFVYEAFLPPWMEMGRTCRVCVMGAGTIKDGDRDHRVVFSSTNPNEQLVAVVGPGHLAVELGRASVAVRPGQTVEIPIRVKRGVDWKGPVTVSLIAPRHIQGIDATSVIIPADADRGTLTLRIGPNPTAAITMPLTVRATLSQSQQRLVADTPLELSVD